MFELGQVMKPSDSISAYADIQVLQQKIMTIHVYHYIDRNTSGVLQIYDEVRTKSFNKTTNKVIPEEPICDLQLYLLQSTAKLKQDGSVQSDAPCRLLDLQW